MKKIDLVGQTYGYLTVLAEYGSCKGRVLWRCRCNACGNEKIVKGQKLRSGEVKSCGCMHRKYGHQQTETRLYHIWCTMKARCNNPKSHKYSRYGGRGIKCCSEWNEFIQFYEWAIANDYDDSLTLDRIDNNKGYCPENCRWATPKIQANNTSNNRTLKYKGEMKTISEIAEIENIPYTLLYKRIKRGWSLEDAISLPKLYGIHYKNYKERKCS